MRLPFSRFFIIRPIKSVTLVQREAVDVLEAAPLGHPRDHLIIDLMDSDLVKREIQPSLRETEGFASYAVGSLHHKDGQEVGFTDSSLLLANIRRSYSSSWIWQWGAIRSGVSAWTSCISSCVIYGAHV